MVSYLVDSAVFWSDVVKIFSLRNPLNVSLSSRSVLEDWGQGSLVGALLGDADTHDAHVHRGVVLQGVANHQRFLIVTNKWSEVFKDQDPQTQPGVRRVNRAPLTQNLIKVK